MNPPVFDVAQLLATSCKVMLPYHDSEKQAKLLHLGICMPVRRTGLCDVVLGKNDEARSIVHVAGFGDGVMQELYKDTGGNPLTELLRANMCIAFTRTLTGVHHDELVYGAPDKGANSFAEVPLPNRFEVDVSQKQKQVLHTCRRACGPATFSVVGQKLNPLRNGKVNIAMFLHFPGGVPFPHTTRIRTGDRQDSRIRVVPRPIIAQFDDPVECQKISFRFLWADAALYTRSHDILASIIQNRLRMYPRLIKYDPERSCMDVYVQADPDSPQQAPPTTNGTRLLMRRMGMKKVFAPYVLCDVSVEDAELM